MPRSGESQSRHKLDAVVKAVCRLPIDAALADVSAIDLIRASGYVEYRRDVSVERLRECLTEDPRLVDAWLQWSADNRSTPAWHVTTLESGAYEVGFLNRTIERQVTFDERIAATSEYVHHYLEQLADDANSMRRPWELLTDLFRRLRER
jgi:hypothetical protein